MSKVAIVMLSMSHPDLTQQSLAQIANTIGSHDCKILLINNGGGEEIRGMPIINQLPMIEYMELEKNIGVARGRNVGIEWFLKTDCEYLINIDNDVFPLDGWLDELLANFKPGVGMTAPVSNYANGRQGIRIFTMPNPGMELEFWQTRWNNLVEDRDLQAHEHETYIYDYNEVGYWRVKGEGYLIGFCTCVPREIVKEIGSYDDKYLLYGNEDADYYFTMKNLGYEGAICPKSVIFHYGSRGLKALGPMGEAEWMRSRRHFYRKWGFAT